MSAASKPIRVLPNELYIEPTTVCNLKCKMCYTNVINGPDKRVIPDEQILDFVHRFAADTTESFSIYWCGLGEIFLHPGFTQMVNELIERYGDRLSQTIQTNGTVDRLDDLITLKPLHFNVSIDGLREAHEWHRGAKTYDKTIAFCKRALDGGCQSLTIRTLLMRDNINSLAEFHAELTERLGPRFELKLTTPLDNNDIRSIRSKSLNIVRKDVDDSQAISTEEARSVLSERYAGRYALDGRAPAIDNYLSLTTQGVFSCCDGIVKLGDISTNVGVLKEQLVSSQQQCRDCVLFPCR